MENKVYLLEGGDGVYDSAYPFIYGIFLDKGEAENRCLEINNLIIEAKRPFFNIDCFSDEFDILSNEQKERYFEVKDLWQVSVVEREVNVLYGIGILK